MVSHIALQTDIFFPPATHHSCIAPRSGISTPAVCNSPVQTAQYHILSLYIRNLHTKLLPLKICDSPPDIISLFLKIFISDLALS